MNSISLVILWKCLWSSVIINVWAKTYQNVWVNIIKASCFGVVQR